jgi:hypothetical protein
VASLQEQFGQIDIYLFDQLLRGRIAPGGLFFCRLASSIGIESRVQHLEGRRFLLPDGSERYLVDEPLLMSLAQDLGAQLTDPLKTTVVQNQRSMTTWVLRKLPSPPQQQHLKSCRCSGRANRSCQFCKAAAGRVPDSTIGRRDFARSSASAMLEQTFSTPT